VNILIIGAGSFMSDYLIPELLSRKHTVHATYHTTVKRISGVVYHQVDVTQPAQFASLPVVDTIINFSASISEDPEQCERVNVKGMQNILDYCSRAGVKTIIHSSTTAVYGKPQFLPITEEHPRAANTNYGQSKLQAEKLIEQSAAQHGFRHVMFRYASPFGYGQKVTSVLPIFIKKARAGENLEIYGDGSRTQEFIYVRDIVVAHLNALESTAAGAYNIGSGNVVSMKQLAELILRIFGNGRAKLARKDIPDTGVNMAIDSSKARRELGFTATYDINTALQEYTELMNRSQATAR
jgi:UDP-glucose 4-epimerase